MDSKSLKKLNRRELLEVLVNISEQNETLLSENEQLKAELENKRLSAREVGTLAQAALDANDFFVVADRAAKQFLENIAFLEQETKEKCAHMVEETMLECNAMREQAGLQAVPYESVEQPTVPEELNPVEQYVLEEEQAVISDENQAPVSEEEQTAVPDEDQTSAAEEAVSIEDFLTRENGDPTHNQDNHD